MRFYLYRPLSNLLTSFAKKDTIIRACGTTLDETDIVMKYRPVSDSEAESAAPVSSCLEKVVLTFILVLGAITMVGAGLGSGSAAGGDCQVSEDFPHEVRRWCSLITREASENDLHPDLIAALIWQESGGNPRAYSHSGAVGLMQVMPRDGLAAAFNCPEGPCFEDRPTTSQLRNPNFNVDYGAEMLQGLVRKHRGNLREALREYGPMDVGYYYADTVISLYRQYGRD